MNDRLLRRAVPLALSFSLAFGAASAPAFASPAKAAEAISWSFAKDLEGWHYDGKWAYDGEPAALHLSEVGSGALAFDADYRGQKENGWSEVKFGAGAASEAQPLDVGRSNRLSFDFYFRPEAMTQGAFQTKVYMKTTAGAEVSAVTAIGTKNAADAGNGWKKAQVTAAFDTPAAPLTLLEVNIVGSETDYCGKLVIDNITLSYDDGYVTRTVQPAKQEKVDLKKLQTPTQVALTDAKAIPNAAKLYSFLGGIANSDYVHYYGDNELLRGAYSTNCGPGCAIRPSLSANAVQKGDGSYGLDFHYSLVKGGWAGIIKSMGVDWSAYDAVSFWFYPDGKGQKFIIQMNSDGEDFEVNLTDLAKKTTPQHVVLPFKDFVGKNGGTFHPERLQHFAIYCNTVGDEPVDSHFYLDDIRAIRQ